MRRALERMGYEMNELLPRRRLQALPQHGLQRPHRHPRTAGDRRRDPRARSSSDPSISNIREMAQRHGMITLRHDGFRKVREGITTIEEILHVVGDSSRAGTSQCEPTASREVESEIAHSPTATTYHCHDFQYRVRDTLGNVHEGTLEAESSDEATQQLRRDGVPGARS